MLEINTIHIGDNLDLLKKVENNSIHCCVTSPPYFNLRSYLPNNSLLKEKEIGCYSTPEEYISKLADVFDEVYRVLKNDGTCFIIIGDTYLGSGKGVWKGREKANKESFQFQEKPKEKLCGWKKQKQLALIPSRLAIELQNRGWLLRNKIIWYKGNAIPQSCKDRFTVDYEEILFLTKNKKYYFNQPIEPFANSSNPLEIYTGQATKKYEEQNAQNPSDTKRRILDSMRKRGGRSMRSVWKINTKPAKGNHTASFPEELVDRIIKAGCPENGIILDIFNGTGTSCYCAKKLNRNYLGLELNPEYCNIANERLNNAQRI